MGLVNLELAEQLTREHPSGRPYYGFDPERDYLIRALYHSNFTVGPPHAEIVFNNGEAIYPACPPGSDEQTKWDWGFRLYEFAHDWSPSTGKQERRAMSAESDNRSVAVRNVRSSYVNSYIVYERSKAPPRAEEPFWEHLNLTPREQGAPDPRKRPAPNIGNYGDFLDRQEQVETGRTREPVGATAGAGEQPAERSPANGDIYEGLEAITDDL